MSPQRYTKTNALFRSTMTNHGAELPRVKVECESCRKSVEKLTECAGKFLCDDCKKSTNQEAS